MDNRLRFGFILLSQARLKRYSVFELANLPVTYQYIVTWHGVGVIDSQDLMRLYPNPPLRVAPAAAVWGVCGLDKDLPIFVLVGLNVGASQTRFTQRLQNRPRRTSQTTYMLVRDMRGRSPRYFSYSSFDMPN